MNTDHPRAAINGLAVVGFIALVAAGIWLAVYSTRFVPTVVNRIGSAAVYLGSIFTSGNGPTLSVVSNPAASTTISFGPADQGNASSNISTSAAAKPKPTATTAGEKKDSAHQISETTNALYGLPDLSVTIIAIGYLATTSADSFVASSTVPSGSRPAVRFTIKNIGTNATGLWRFSASIPTSSNFIYQSVPQQNLNPGDYIEYTLGFDQAIAGSNKMISVTANFDKVVGESDSNNNSASTQLTILGS